MSNMIHEFNSKKYGLWKLVNTKKWVFNGSVIAFQNPNFLNPIKIKKANK